MKKPLGLLVTATLALGVLTVSPAYGQDLQARTERVRELVQARGYSRFVTNVPNSRSTMLAVDVSTSLFFFLERGSVRGDAVGEIYAAIEADDMETAYELFDANAIMTIRATDYGWNGLGVPFVAASGNEINDILFKDMGGTFRRAESIEAADLASYEENLDAVLAALEQ